MSAAGAVAELWRFPVKSMLGERVDALDVTSAGIVGDRAYGILDPATGKVASAKHPKLWPSLFGCRARFLAPPTRDVLPPALMVLADGTQVRTDAPDVDAALSAFLGREVRLITASPQEYLIDEFRPEQGGVVDQPLGAALFAALGMPSPVPEGALVDLFPVSVLTTSSLRYLNDFTPDAAWDARRFRMNVIVETAEDGPIENGWTGSTLAIGDAVTLTVTMPTPRCVMTNLALEELPRDPQILKTIGAHNRLDLPGIGRYPCLGGYAVPAGTGQIRIGDVVRAADLTTVEER